MNEMNSRECEKCGDLFDADVYEYCHDCYVECGGCGQVVEYDELISPADSCALRCVDCLESCQWCDEYFRFDIDDHLRYCDECGEWFCPDFQREYSYCEECDCLICDQCECSNCSGGGRVHDYCYKPAVRFNGTGPVFMGMELEVGGSNSFIVDTVNDFDCDESLMYLKRDGSLPEGLEIVTHPMSLDYAHEFPFDSMLRKLQNGCRVDDGYGLHVHVSRTAFTGTGKGKQSVFHSMAWLLFMSRNEADIEKVARRNSDQWAAFVKPQRGELRRKARQAVNDHRYVAVNCNNLHTYEVRVFKSALNARDMYAALEFVDASVEYTRGLTSAECLGRNGGLTWSRFVAWAASQGTRYRNLVDLVAPELVTW